MFQHQPGRSWVRSAGLAVAVVAGGWLNGSRAACPSLDLAAESPVPVTVAAREASRLAEAFVAANRDCDVMVGSGGSMQPLYPDHTVLVVQRFPMSKLHRGMTVVFIGDTGRPVAHILLEKTARGWTAQGLANADPDRTPVRLQNYVGVVVRAFTPVIGGDVAVASAEE